MDSELFTISGGTNWETTFKGLKRTNTILAFFALVAYLVYVGYVIHEYFSKPKSTFSSKDNFQVLTAATSSVNDQVGYNGMSLNDYKLSQAKIQKAYDESTNAAASNAVASTFVGNNRQRMSQPESPEEKLLKSQRAA
jgi:hypothetical protein